MLFVARRQANTKEKKLCVIRYGAWGDAIMLSPVFKYYKEQKWYIILNCTQKCYDILKTNPYIDGFLIQEDNEIPFEKLEDHWTKLKKQFDKLINFSGSIESSLLIAPYQKEFEWSKEKRHKLCNINYYDRTMKLAGFPKKKGELGELYFTKNEEKWARKLTKKHSGFNVLVCLSGSSIHKIYPYMDAIINAIVDGLPNTHVFLVGEPGTKGIIDKHKQITDFCGEISIRKSFVLAKHLNLVISPETSVLVAAGCFDTPKIALLSHGSEENLTKYYKNCHTIVQNVSCQPCHKLHYQRDTCPVIPETKFPICMGLLHPKKILPAIEKVYGNWKKQILGA